MSLWEQAVLQLRISSPSCFYDVVEKNLPCIQEMHPRRNKAISVALSALIILVAIAGVAGGLHILGQTQACFGCVDNGVRTMEITSMAFNAFTATLYFTSYNPMSTATSISSVNVNQMSCNGDFTTLRANTETSESCVVSGGTFTSGGTVKYVTTFANGQSIQGSLIAQ